MDFLYFLQDIRNPVLDAFMSLITHLGEELIFMVVALVIFWCVDKYQGYYILSVGFLGTVINQFLKITFRIPRPWVIDKNFNIVESARAEATGYSFPSGHTQSSVGTFGSIARWNKNKTLRIICIALCVLIPISRMYLGVHTPKDVVASLIVAAALIFIIYPIIIKAKSNPKVMWWFICCMFLITLAGTIYVIFYNFPSSVDAENLLSAQENFCKLLGCILGMAVIYFIDTKYIKFKTDASALGQILKVVLGLAVIVALKEGLKPIITYIFGNNLLMQNSLRYFITVVFAGAVWPLTFKRLSKIGKK